MNAIHAPRRSNTPGIIGEHLLLVVEFWPGTGFPRYFHEIRNNTNLYRKSNAVLASLQAGRNPVHNSLAQFWRRLTPNQFRARVPFLEQHFKIMRLLYGRNVRSRTSNRKRPRTPNSNRNN